MSELKLIFLLHKTWKKITMVTITSNGSLCPSLQLLRHSPQWCLVRRTLPFITLLLIWGKDAAATFNSSQTRKKKSPGCFSNVFISSWSNVSYLRRGEARHPEGRVDQRNFSFQQHLHIMSCAPVQWGDSRFGYFHTDMNLSRQTKCIFVLFLQNFSLSLSERNSFCNWNKPKDRGKHWCLALREKNLEGLKLCASSACCSLLIICSRFVFSVISTESTALFSLEANDRVLALRR